MFVYKTHENKQYSVYELSEITVKKICGEIEGSEYFNKHYVYAKEKLEMQHKKEKATKRMETLKKKIEYLTHNGQPIPKNITDKYKKSVISFNASEVSKIENLSNIRMGFDIETTRVDDIENGIIVDSRSYMYHWQFSVNNAIITGRTWNQFNLFMSKLLTALDKELHKAVKRNGGRWGRKNHPFCIIWVANLPFEFQFIKDLFKWQSIFAKDNRKPLTSAIDNETIYNKPVKFGDMPLVQFQDCLQITGGTLENLAKEYTTTKKLVGDLDYNKKRNSLTAMSGKDLHYCYNDVAILSEWHEFYYNFYKKQGYATMTATGILRHEVKKRQTVDDLLKVYDMIGEDKDEYRYVMNYVFKGGYSHSNLSNVNKEINNEIYSWDITSSYPYVMLTKKFPMSAFQEYKPLKDELNRLSKSHDKLHSEIKKLQNDIFFYAEIELTKVMAKDYNTYISYSKTINGQEIADGTKKYDNHRLPMTLIDNGRILKAERVVVAETETDILTILEMYDFDEIKFNRVMMCAETDYLPEYITEPLKDAYIVKASYKKKKLTDTVEYKISKSKVNAGYGMMCTKLIVNEIFYSSENKEWCINEKTKGNGLRDQLFLNYMWGVYVTAFARRRLMKMIIVSGDNMACSDTDSIYSKMSNELMEAIETENNRVIEDNKKRFNNNWLDDIGVWDKQSVDKQNNLTPYEKFATMGAKRYVLFGWNEKHYGWKQTIAGLPKTALVNYCEKNGNKISPIDMFLGVGGFNLTRDFADKKTTIYHDSPHSDIVTDYQGNTEIMNELSSVSIVPIEFTMSISHDFALVLGLYASRVGNIKTEKRLI